MTAGLIYSRLGEHWGSIVLMIVGFEELCQTGFRRASSLHSYLVGLHVAKYLVEWFPAAGLPMLTFW